MDRPHHVVTTQAQRPRQHHRIGRRGLMKLAAGVGVATMGVAGRGLILPWVDFGRAAAAEFVEPDGASAGWKCSSVRRNGGRVSK